MLLSSSKVFIFFHFCFPPGVAMEEVTRLVSTGDCVKVWDASMAPLEQFNPHSISHPVSQACWSSNSILMCFSFIHSMFKETCMRLNRSST